MQLLESLGADSVNPVRDLPIPILAAIRAAVTVQLDCHTDNPAASGGFIRFYDAPAFVRHLSPVNLKVGNSALARHGHVGTEEESCAAVQRCVIVAELVEQYCPEKRQG